MSNWEDTIYSLIVKASTELPDDVKQALSKAIETEAEGSNARRTLETMLHNGELACRSRRPICQDTGTLIFYIKVPPGFSPIQLKQSACKAVRQATADGLLRQNCVDPLTERNTTDNTGPGSPIFHIREDEETDHDRIEISLILKGGGCENVGCQYTLPDSELSASRDFKGVQKCALDAVWQAQGRGCAPGVLSLCIGGDRATGYEASKQQLLRPLGERSSVPEFAELEEAILTSANKLGIGPMGLGGKTTLLDVFITRLGRVPASYFVSVSYMCWAYRKQRLTASRDGIDVRWDD